MVKNNSFIFYGAPGPQNAKLHWLSQVDDLEVSEVLLDMWSKTLDPQGKAGS